MSQENQTIKFPQSAQGHATLWQIWECRARMLLARIANRLGFPGCIGSIVLDDPVTGRHLEIRPGLLFTVISVNGRDYYFRRFSGKYDGTGMCRCVKRPSGNSAG
jgi:hypothetical protein